MYGTFFPGVGGGGGDPIPVTDCLLCGHHSSNVERNVTHMTNCSLFLPDADYIVDLEGLIEYLGAKVGEGNICLWCNRAFRYSKTPITEKKSD